MNETQLLNSLAQAGAQLRVDEQELIIHAPKGRLDPGLLEQVKQRKDALVAALRDGTFFETDGRFPQVEPDPDNWSKPFPLTEIQQAYWLGRNPSFELGNVGIHVYEEVDCLDLDLGRLGRAWQRVLDRHQMLRAVLTPDGRQRILENPRFEIEARDLRRLDDRAQSTKLEAIRRRLSHHVYSPQEWPLFTIVACRLNDRLCRLYLSIDAINLDMGSLALVFRDWVQFYTSPETELPELELSYRDYALALNQVEQSELYRRSLEYWRGRARVLAPAPLLPMAAGAVRRSSPKFVRRSAELDEQTWQRLKESALKRGLTPSGIALAGYAEVLAAWSPLSSFTVNVTLFNRLPIHPQVAEIAGDFTSMILLGVDHDDSLAFEARAAAIQRQLWHDMQYRYVSGVRVLRELSRSLGKNIGQAIMPCVFTGLLNMRTQGFRPLSQLGNRVFSIVQTPQVSLDLQAYQQDGRLVVNWDSVDDLFPPGMMEDMFEAYRGVLIRLANSEASWGGSNLLLIPGAQEERRKAVNATDAPIPRQTLDGLFVAQARERPSPPAVVGSSRQLSYLQLHRQTMRIADRLRNWGIASDDRVGVLMEKGWEQVAAAMGIVQSGAAYVPLDPTWPAVRLQQVLNDAGIRIALTQPQLDTSLNWPPDVERIDIEFEEEGPEDTLSPDEAHAPENLAYVLYTSGSTGEPKGVMIEHRSVVNRILDVNQRFDVGPADRVFGLTALHHDLSVYDVFGTLAAGAAMVLPEPALAKDPAHWIKLISDHRITIWNSVPAFMEMLVQHLEEFAPHPPPVGGSLRLVLLAGDWIPVSLPDRIRKWFPAAQVISLGGPTETTVWDICYPLGDVDPKWKSIPYGKPMRNARYYVLNEALRPRPDWVQGELYIAGAGLSRGYLGDPKKTRESFVEHPATGERLYRSGDLGRYLPDGSIQFLGRKDFQIKVRGQRIEAGEVESVLKRHDQVGDAIVAAQGQGDQDKRLVAYVVPNRRENGSAGKYGPSVQPDLYRQNQAEISLQQPGLRGDAYRFPNLSLKEHRPSQTIIHAHRERSTWRQFRGGPIPLERFQRFLGCLRGIDLMERPLPKYRYPSAGSLYSVQVYLSIKPNEVEGVAPGIHYYHPTRHRLAHICEAEIEADVHRPHNIPIFEQSAFTLFLIASLKPAESVYGELARDFCLLEAGYMSQLLMMEASAHDIGLCPIGDIDFDRIRGLFSLDAEFHCLHSLLGGPSDSGNLGTGSILTSCLQQTSAEDGRKGLVDELRSLLEVNLPDYMIPSSFVLLDAFPLTANGKVDRQSLPKAGPSNVIPAEIRAPESELEKTVVSVFKDVIGVEAMGLDDRFFDLGANSMHLVQASHRLSRNLGLEVPVVEIFRHPTAGSLVEYLLGRSQQEAPVRDGRERAEIRRKALRNRRSSPKNR